jgi:superoxide dismutase
VPSLCLLLLAEIMELHHSKHHNTYVTNLNAATQVSKRPAVVEARCWTLSADWTCCITYSVLRSDYRH